ncbi:MULTISPECIES: TIGR03758 family integrating conjugative element protein [Pectobacterium]|uniref:TIGR03758 family integrating conjugative element protein n=1 Tax=Pectobacterium aquaticum TaxID=2204145 RepID=A0AA93AN82_9GAMM|nr:MULTISPECIES: TIGR03758 family integrating conjugative element protein [Pectobacterium]MBE5221344.1 TIGR03758 family integrating conjugative element protein [Pectobacterium quasiaquaticum]MCH5052235.1 TIGR03758 family integrating conjugative element protein [Pectobacterium aquaticum]RRN95055.1 TIGR03758 family integrating conjugative element protein [Pectobacterium aquaticum]RRO03594.1 TIGR03758 family integrating conjugative element protein [Pectobacterium aquaticum]RRO22425.1 TIGR03758 fa
MSMTAAQSSAFKSASGFDPQILNLICVGFLLAALFLWAAWALGDVWNGWANEKVRDAAMGRFAFRAAILLVISIWMFAS